MSAIFPLSPIDHVFTGIGSYPIEFVFSYNGILDESKLRDSLKESLSFFPVMSSKLVPVSDNTFGLQVTADGLRFETVISSEKFSETSQHHIYIDPVESIGNEPLARFRLTQTPAGSVLGVSISHAIADGFSYFYFLSSWARIFNCKPVYPPSHDRQKLIPGEFNRPLKVSADDVRKHSGLFLDEKRKSYSRQTQIWDVLKFSNETLKKMVDEVQEASGTRISVNDVITARLWKTYMEKWKNGDNLGESFISCPVDFRRIYPGFPQTYFGNAVTLATASLDYNDLLNSDLPKLAILIRSTVAGVDEAYVNRSLATLAALNRQEGPGINEHIHVAHPRSGLLVTNLSRLPVNEIAFNAGPPAAYEILTTAQRGAVVLPSSDGIEVRVCCPS